MVAKRKGSPVITREKYKAEYLYPGTLFPEETYRSLSEPTLEAALAAQPDESGWFRKDGWYAVKVMTIVEKKFVAGDGEVLWNRIDKTEVSYLIGERVHVDQLPDDDDHRTLRANIRVNTDDGWAVKTRAGNYQFPKDYDQVLSPEELLKVH